MSKQYIIDKATGEVTEYKPGQLAGEGRPVFLVGPDGIDVLVEMTDKQGNPMLVSASTLIRLHEHKHKAKDMKENFIDLGKRCGVTPDELVGLTADHIWNGGDFKNLDWVATALDQMGIRHDLRNRWYHAWRTYLHLPMPAKADEKKGTGE